MIEDKHYFKAFQWSFLVHALIIIFILIGTGGYLKPADRFVVVDFCIEDPPNSGHRTFSASEIKVQQNIMRQKASTVKEGQEKQKDQGVQKGEQKKEVTSHATPVIPEPLVTEKPQVISQINPDAIPAETTQNFAMVSGSHPLASGRTGSSNDSPYMEESATTYTMTAYGQGSGGTNRLKTAEYLRKNFFYIRDLIQKKIVYPALARRMGWEGKVVTSFIVSSAGYARDVKISKSSGYEILDENALKAINNTSPFPKPPVEAQIIIPILYSLN